MTGGVYSILFCCFIVELKIDVSSGHALIKLVFRRFDWWRGWDPDYENKTHSTDLLNVEAVRVVQVKEKSQMTFEISLKNIF